MKDHDLYFEGNCLDDVAILFQLGLTHTSVLYIGAAKSVRVIACVRVQSYGIPRSAFLWICSLPYAVLAITRVRSDVSLIVHELRFKVLWFR